jgi:polyadenylate-binding protein
LPQSIDEKEFLKLFEAHGKITSFMLKFKTDESKPNGETKGFGFINYEKHEEARAAIEELNGKEINGNELFVGRAQKKSEREKELRQMFDKLKRERMSKYQGVNLYVKNLDESIDDEKLRKEFAECGTITSAKVMVDDKDVSKGFGFVCFATPDEATKAVTQMNGKMINNKPIFVALAERKDERRRKLEFQHAQRNAMRMQPVPGNPMGFQMYYAQRGYLYPQSMMAPRGRFPGRGGFQPQSPFMMPPQGGGRGGPRGGRGAPKQPAGNYKLNSNVRNQPSEPLNKQQLGEKMYPLISESLRRIDQEKLAGKITGMLLESLNLQELNLLCENSEDLDRKISEALEVLESAEKKSRQ